MKYRLPPLHCLAWSLITVRLRDHPRYCSQYSRARDILPEANKLTLELAPPQFYNLFPAERLFGTYCSLLS
jgi:hypothetical protein